MISRELFKKVILHIMEESELFCELSDVYDKHRTIVGDAVPPMLNSELMVDMLNETFKLPIDDTVGSDLDYWLWECDYGKNWNSFDVENTNLPEGHRYRHPKINNLDELYDYLKFLHDTVEIEELLGDIENHDEEENQTPKGKSLDE